MILFSLSLATSLNGKNEYIYLFTFVLELSWQFSDSEKGSLFAVMAGVFLIGNIVSSPMRSIVMLSLCTSRQPPPFPPNKARSTLQYYIAQLYHLHLGSSSYLVLYHKRLTVARMALNISLKAAIPLNYLETRVGTRYWLPKLLIIS